jgi:hypothetical protein
MILRSAHYETKENEVAVGDIVPVPGVPFEETLASASLLSRGQQQGEASGQGGRAAPRGPVRHRWWPPAALSSSARRTSGPTARPARLITLGGQFAGQADPLLEVGEQLAGHLEVNAHGEDVTLDPDGPLAEAAWARQRLGRATQALPNGFCGLPLARTCPHANACLTCPLFVTTAGFLPQHRAQHATTLQVISAAEARGQTRMAQMNQQVASNLEKIITALENDEEGTPEMAADAP